MENFIKEAKNGFFFDKSDSSHFLENAVRMMVKLSTHHVYQDEFFHILRQIQSLSW